MKLPVVAIVGRPNVGKSSLFNRLLGDKVAIVDDRPGVTRDRIVREADINEHTVLLVDTGGVADSKEALSKEVREQAERAMKEADVIVFVVDAKEGLNPIDLEIARILRRWEKPVIVVANKVDEPFMENLAYEFYKLGFDNVIPLSTIHKIGVATLKENIVSLLPPDLKEQAKRKFDAKESDKRVERLLDDEDALLEISKKLESGQESDLPEVLQEPPKIALIGRPNVGKSTLLNALSGQDRAIVSSMPGTTRDAIDSTVKIGGKEYTFIDTAGIRRRGKIKDLEYYSFLRAVDAIDRADIALLLIDGTEGATERDAKVAGLALEKYKPLIIAVNKTDLLSKEEREKLKRQLDLIFDFVSYAPRVFISAKQKKGIKKLLKEINDVYEQYTKKVKTAQFNKLIQTLMNTYQPPTYRGKIVKIYYGTQVKTKPPTFLLFTNFPDGIPKSFRRFLENKIRKELGFSKVPVRVVFKQRH